MSAMAVWTGWRVAARRRSMRSSAVSEVVGGGAGDGVTDR